MAAANSEFEFLGVNHLALVCKDMAKTVEFYRDVLDLDLNGHGQPPRRSASSQTCDQLLVLDANRRKRWLLVGQIDGRRRLAVGFDQQSTR